ncbi:hypothetical protein HCC61_11165 [Streptomyces sp. HNM0575]|uniref:hypothetical protein n=1 Tax=Streptomyces sp. HNM0575 TaxID=2716338 RepID=UPI00145F5F3D|nr:hypothetical protein [Streptomyces sp. HNM0575]NLU73232.1 hypothetical protein [Streptomyces sp. HNM0575]
MPLTPRLLLLVAPAALAVAALRVRRGGEAAPEADSPYGGPGSGSPPDRPFAR